MSNLNPDQFGERKPGVYRGERGEPDPDTYARDQDWLHDHKRFVARRNEGKAYTDPDMEKIRRRAKQEDDLVIRSERVREEGNAQTRRAVVQGLRGLNRAAGRIGMKKRRKIW